LLVLLIALNNLHQQALRIGAAVFAHGYRSLVQ
jgi:hypothetical protein